MREAVEVRGYPRGRDGDYWQLIERRRLRD